MTPIEAAVRRSLARFGGVEDAETREMAEILAATVPGVLRLEFD